MREGERLKGQIEDRDREVAALMRRLEVRGQSRSGCRNQNPSSGRVRKYLEDFSLFIVSSRDSLAQDLLGKLKNNAGFILSPVVNQNQKYFINPRGKLLTFLVQLIQLDFARLNPGAEW